MNLGIDKVINSGNGNAIIFTALLAGAVANTIPTPFDAIYFRRVNTIEHEYNEGLRTAENKEWHIAGEYYLWTSLWYVCVFAFIYSLNGKYSDNVKILFSLIAVGFVVGAVQKNIEVDKRIKSVS